MTEFWEQSFQEKQTMWGFDPADSATQTAERFKALKLQNILIPGFGYGRNAKAFIDQGQTVTGIEISETAIALAKKHFKPDLNLYHGSVSHMPFDAKIYDGIFCYALIHLLAPPARKKLIDDCYKQLRSGGVMVFTAISANTPAYGKGRLVAPKTFETPHGVTIFYAHQTDIKQAFNDYGIIETKEIEESGQIFWQITCTKTL